MSKLLNQTDTSTKTIEKKVEEVKETKTTEKKISLSVYLLSAKITFYIQSLLKSKHFMEFKTKSEWDKLTEDIKKQKTL